MIKATQYRKTPIHRTTDVIVDAFLRLVYFVDMAETMYSTEQAADVSRDFLLDSRVSTWHREVFEHKGNEQKTDNESHV